MGKGILLALRCKIEIAIGQFVYNIFKSKNY